jgi:cell fate regulator YaaT (PSP1 superfamily)
MSHDGSSAERPPRPEAQETDEPTSTPGPAPDSPGAAGTAAGDQQTEADAAPDGTARVDADRSDTGRPRRGGPERGGGRKVVAALVRFNIPGQFAEFDATGVEVRRADKVVVEADRGQSVGTVVSPPKNARPKRPLRRLLRVVNDDDEKVISRNRVREREAFHFCVERIKARKLPMKLIAVELAHSGTRAVFYFSSTDRVDFRALVKDLARRFHTRIEMRQIGVRDAARHTGGTGICGRELCCATWLPSFKPISIRMAKDQNLSLNHQKLSGLCGRLRCCLQYEQELYQAQRKGLPKAGKRVVTPQGEGRVKDVNVLKRRVRVQLSEDGTYVEFDAAELTRPGDALPPQPQTEPSRPPAAQPSGKPRPDRQHGQQQGQKQERQEAGAQKRALGEPTPGQSADTGADGPGREQPRQGKRRRRRRGRRRRGKGGGRPGSGDGGGNAPQ